MLLAEMRRRKPTWHQENTMSSIISYLVDSADKCLSMEFQVDVCSE